MNADLIKLIAGQAESNADTEIASILPGLSKGLPVTKLVGLIALVHAAVVRAYQRGADAGYTAAKAEARPPTDPDQEP